MNVLLINHPCFIKQGWLFFFIMIGRQLLSFILFFSPFWLISQTIDLRIYSGYKISDLALVVNSGIYCFKDSVNDTASYQMGDSLFFFIHNSQLGVILKNGDSVYIKNKECLLVANKLNSNFKLIPDTLLAKPLIYQGNLKVKSQDSLLFLTNIVDFEQYLAGVIQAESGTKANEEFYKAQAVISRTYAYKNIQRHRKEGYDLCDDVHCQVYKGMCTYVPIQMAVFETTGLCIVDKNNQLIEALFHAHCGGQTSNSEDVWHNVIPYLRSVKDTFCLPMKNAQWQQKIAVGQWLDFAKNKGKTVYADSIILQSALNYKQPERKALFDGGFKMALTKIRSNFGLKSTFFEISAIENDSLVVAGKGYGHGVGLCQSGAMRMALLGMPYQEIIKFYYKDVEIRPMPFPKLMGTK